MKFSPGGHGRPPLVVGERDSGTDGIGDPVPEKRDLTQQPDAHLPAEAPLEQHPPTEQSDDLMHGSPTRPEPLQAPPMQFFEVHWFDVEQADPFSMPVPHLPPVHALAAHSAGFAQVSPSALRSSHQEASAPSTDSPVLQYLQSVHAAQTVGAPGERATHSCPEGHSASAAQASAQRLEPQYPLAQVLLSVHPRPAVPLPSVMVHGPVHSQYVRVLWEKLLQLPAGQPEHPG